jgi:hypothetical protein
MICFLILYALILFSPFLAAARYSTLLEKDNLKKLRVYSCTDLPFGLPPLFVLPHAGGSSSKYLVMGYLGRTPFPEIISFDDG